MNLLLFILLGGMVGLAVRYYLSHFAYWVAQEIYQAYRAIFAPNIPETMSLSSTLSPIKCGHFFSFFIYFAAVFIICYCVFNPLYQALFMACYISLLICISLTDWYYQLISLPLCQALFVLGLGAAWASISTITLEQSLQSAFSGFMAFYVIYLLAKWVYAREALGRGDYWLMLGLSSVLHWSQLPLLVLIACCCAMGYAFFAKFYKQAYCQLPFAPFLCLADIVMILLNWKHESMISLF
ncbi:prepilin peptidase [Pasteurella oralis]|uniref:Prepilin peptidase n=1 Tax=Pasteurella oralis TaxID=1071947 RepID=A0ABW4NX86_9PAST